MIRESKSSDLEAIIEIWLKASRLAHDFIAYDFWLSNVDDMRNVYIPNSCTYVNELGFRIIGFASICGDHLSALFVDPAFQNSGYGKILLRHMQSIKTDISLCVYKKNEKAIEFYRHFGFKVEKESFDEKTKEMECTMTWKSGIF